MSRHNIFAYTAGGNYPEYLSVNWDSDGQFVEVTVRSPAVEGRCGETVSVRMTHAEFAKFARAAFGYACTGNA
jgi:hypothetical protein